MYCVGINFFMFRHPLRPVHEHPEMLQELCLANLFGGKGGVSLFESADSDSCGGKLSGDSLEVILNFPSAPLASV